MNSISNNTYIQFQKELSRLLRERDDSVNIGQQLVALYRAAYLLLDEANRSRLLRMFKYTETTIMRWAGLTSFAETQPTIPLGQMREQENKLVQEWVSKLKSAVNEPLGGNEPIEVNVAAETDAISRLLGATDVNAEDPDFLETCRFVEKILTGSLNSPTITRTKLDNDEVKLLQKAVPGISKIGDFSHKRSVTWLRLWDALLSESSQLFLARIIQHCSAIIFSADAHQIYITDIDHRFFGHCEPTYLEEFPDAAPKNIAVGALRVILAESQSPGKLSEVLQSRPEIANSTP